jgi:crotonobetainyl-CoA:carnitine CoA-transferase CaiB-like acyl-CoA transferase
VKTHLGAAADPQVHHLGLLSSYDHPRAGRVRIVGPAVRMSRTPPTVERPAPIVRRHTRQMVCLIWRSIA